MHKYSKFCKELKSLLSFECFQLNRDAQRNYNLKPLHRHHVHNLEHMVQKC
jgi:hypothetical protein